MNMLPLRTQHLSGKRISIIPFPALGDNTIYLRMAQSLTQAGASVSFYSDLLASAADLFDWLVVKPLAGNGVDQLAANCDLLIADVLAQSFAAYAQTTTPLPENLLTVTAKRLPERYCSLRLPQTLQNIAQGETHRSLCLGEKQGRSMVEWVDDYTQHIFGVNAAPTPPAVNTKNAGFLKGSELKNRRVLIFPTTPYPNKNYSLNGFLKIADQLATKGWITEFVCMPHEQTKTESAIAGRYAVLSFQSLRELILHLAISSVVISNDSGGGHLGAMLGLKTVTITKKSRDFVWRPGFAKNRVVSPYLTFKWLSGRIWKPFIRHQEILNFVGLPTP